MSTGHEINKKIAADGYQKVTEDAVSRVALIQTGLLAVDALLDPRLSDEARLEVFGVMLEARDGEQITIDRQAELGLQQDLGRTANFLTARKESEERSAEDTQSMVRWIEENGLPEL